MAADSLRERCMMPERFENLQIEMEMCVKVLTDKWRDWSNVDLKPRLLPNRYVSSHVRREGKENCSDPFLAKVLFPMGTGENRSRYRTVALR